MRTGRRTEAAVLDINTILLVRNKLLIQTEPPCKIKNLIFIHSVYINLSNKIDVSNLDIQYIDEDEASEDISVVDRELNDDYQPKSVRINNAGKIVRGKNLERQPKSIFMNPQQFKDSASTGTGIQLWW